MSRVKEEMAPQDYAERPMIGILPSMTPEQIAAAFAYDGPINHGDEAYLKTPRVKP